MKRSLVIAGGVGILAVAAAVFAMQNPGGTGGLFQATVPPLTIPAGTQMALRLDTSLSTKTSRVGDRFEATVAQDLVVDGMTAVPAGATVTGRVIVAEQPGKASGRGKLQLRYDQLHMDGTTRSLETVSRVYESPSGTKKDVAIIGGSAIGGAILGKVVGGESEDAAKGAAIGAAAGTGATLVTRGPQLTLPRGTALSVRLDHPIDVPRPSA